MELVFGEHGAEHAAGLTSPRLHQRIARKHRRAVQRAHLMDDMNIAFIARDVAKPGIELRVQQHEGRLGRAQRREPLLQAIAKRRFVLADDGVVGSHLPNHQIGLTGRQSRLQATDGGADRLAADSLIVDLDLLPEQGGQPRLQLRGIGEARPRGAYALRRGGSDREDPDPGSRFRVGEPSRLHFQRRLRVGTIRAGRYRRSG